MKDDGHELKGEKHKLLEIPTERLDL